MNRGARPAWLLAVVAMAVGVSCGGGGPRARGFGSRQIYASSDPTLRLSYWIDAGLMFSLGDPAAPGNKRVVDPETGEVTPVPEQPFGAPPPKARFECAYEADGLGTTILTDTQTDVKTRIEGSATCPKTPEDAINVVRLSASGELTVWRGPYDRLERIALGLKLKNVGNYGAATLVVLAAPEADPEAVGLYSIGPGPSDVTEIIPGHLTSAAVAAGGTFVGELSSSRLSRSPLGFGYEFAGVYDEEGHFIYARVMSDGREVYFVGPFATGPRELAIAPVPAERVGGQVDFGHAYPPIHWIERVGDRVALRVWDGAGRRLASCDWLGGVGQWLAGSRGIMVGGTPDGAGNARTGLMIVNFDLAAIGMACTPLEQSGVVRAGISPTGKSIYWIGVASKDEWGLWVADGDGGNPRVVRTTAFMKDPVFLSETRLQLMLNDDLVWVDLSQPEKLHYVAEKTFGVPINLGVSKVITIYDYSAQDDTGTVGIIERETGAKRFISASVAGSGRLALRSRPADEPEGMQLAYVVRGRNPSSQDGIWLATFSSEDLR